MHTIDHPDEYRYSRSKELFERLRQCIDTGELRPNQRLVETQLAKMLGVSRTPIHVALKQLEAMGYVISSSGGLIVADHSLSQVQSLYEVREALETMAVKLACQRATGEQIHKAEEYHTLIIEALPSRDIDRLVELNKAFHEVLCASCGNEQLWLLVKGFRYQYHDRRLARVFTARDWQTQITQHSRILEAVRERNEPLAEKAIRRHLRTTMKIALERL